MRRRLKLNFVEVLMWHWILGVVVIVKQPLLLIKKNLPDVTQEEIVHRQDNIKVLLSLCRILCLSLSIEVKRKTSITSVATSLHIISR